MTQGTLRETIHLTLAAGLTRRDGGRAPLQQSLNFGYNTRAYYGWNNFQFGQGTWKINQMVSIFGGISYSIAMTALKEINQGNEVWASTGVTLSY